MLTIKKGDTVQINGFNWTVKSVGKMSVVLSAEGKLDQKFPKAAAIAFKK